MSSKVLYRYLIVAVSSSGLSIPNSIRQMGVFILELFLPLSTGFINFLYGTITNSIIVLSSSSKRVLKFRPIL